MPATTTVETLVNKITADTSGLTAGYKKAAGETKKLQKGFSDFSGALRRIFVGGAFAFGIKASIDFREEMALTGTLIAGQTKKLEGLGDTAQEFSIKFNKTTDDMAKGAFMVQSAFSDADDITKKWEITTKAATAGNTDVAMSLRGLSAWVKGFGDTSDEAFSKASDLIFQINKLGQTTFQDLAASMGRTIPVWAAMNGKQEELAAGFATLTGVTGDAAEVSTQLAGILRAFIKPTTGMTAAIKKLGYESAEMAIKQKGVIGAMRELVDTTDGSKVAIGKLFRRTEAMTALFALTGGQAETFDNKLEQMNNSAGATDAAFKEVSEGINKTGFEMGQAGKAFTVATQKIFDTVTQSDEFSQSMRTLRDILSSSEFQEAMSWLLARILDMVTALPKLFVGIAELVTQSKELSSQATKQQQRFEELEKQLKNFIKTAGFTKDEYGDLMDAIISTDDASKDFADRTANLLKIMKRMREGEFGSKVAGQYKEWREELRNGIPVIKKSEQETKKAGKTISHVGKDAKGATPEVKKLAQSIQLLAVPATNAGDAFSETENELQKLSQEIDKNIRIDLALADAFGEVDAAAESTGEEIDEQGKSFLNTANSLSTLLDGMIDLIGINGDAAKSMKALSQAANSLAKGDYFGAIVSGAGLVVDMFSGDDGIQDAVAASTALLQDFGITGSDAVQQFADQLAGLDWDIPELMDVEAVQDQLDQMAEEFALADPEFITRETLAGMDELERITADGADSVEELERQVRFAEMAFSDLVRAGMGPGEIIANLDQTIQNLEASAAGLGETGIEALNKLKRFRELAEANKELITQVSDLSTLYEGFSKKGAFDPKFSEDAEADFNNFVESAIKQFEELEKAGFLPGEALQFMAPILEKIRADAEKFGFQLDEDAQKLIDGLDPAAVDPFVEGLERVADILTQIAEKMGVDFGVAAEEAGAAIQDNIGTAIADLNQLRMPSLDMPGLQGAGAGAIPGGGEIAAGQSQTNVVFSPGSITLPTNIETRASRRDVREIIEDDADQIVTIIKEKLEGI